MTRTRLAVESKTQPAWPRSWLGTGEARGVPAVTAKGQTSFCRFPHSLRGDPQDLGGLGLWVSGLGFERRNRKRKESPELGTRLTRLGKRGHAVTCTRRAKAQAGLSHQRLWKRVSPSPPSRPHPRVLSSARAPSALPGDPASPGGPGPPASPSSRTPARGARPLPRQRPAPTNAACFSPLTSAGT